MSKRILSQVQWRLDTHHSAGEHSARRTVFGPNYADLFGRGEGDEDQLSAQNTSLAGQHLQHRKLRILAKGPALKRFADSKLGRVLA